MTTTIEWTQMPGYKGETWNPVAAFHVETNKRGWFCTKPSTGCAHCYSEARNRHVGNGLRFAVGNIDKVRFELVNLARPVHWPKPRMVFVCSMTDLFLEQHTDAMILAVFRTMAAAPSHIFQILTKRPQRMRELLERWITHFMFSPDQLKHCWFGTTTENQDAADERIPEIVALRAILPNAILWLSCEPLLSSIDLSRWLESAPFFERPAIDWVVPGGESGQKARETLLSHIESLVAQCELSGTPCFVKQMGRHPFDDRVDGTDAPLKLSDLKGGKIEEFPEPLRVRQWPKVVG